MLVSGCQARLELVNVVESFWVTFERCVMLLIDAFDAIHLEAVNKDNAETRRIFLFRFILLFVDMQ